MDIPIAPANLNDLCNTKSMMTPDGFASCFDICEQKNCCEDVICTVNNPDACETYEPCSVLQGNLASHPDSIASNVVRKCNTQSLSTKSGIKDCREICGPSMCCFDGTDGTDNCSGDDTEQWCRQFSACLGLENFGSFDNKGFQNSAAAKAAVDTACASSFQECRNICDPAACCYMSKIDSNCEDIGLEDLQCDHYASCETLFETTTTENLEKGILLVDLAVAPTDLEDTCNSPRKDENMRCDKICGSAHCCVEPLSVCHVLEDVCDGYKDACIDKWDNMILEKVIPQPDTEKMFSYCQTGGETPQLSKACKDYCDTASCCTSLVGMDEGTVYNPEMCTEWRPYCVNQWNPEDIIELQPPPVWLKDECDQSPNSRFCLNGCKIAICCTGSEPCGNLLTSGSTCRPYVDAGCGEAWGMIASGKVEEDQQTQYVHIPDSPDPTIENVCTSKKHIDRLKCEEMCRPSVCCLGSLAVGCMPNNQHVCSSYERLCSDAWHEISVEVEIPPLPSGIYGDCSSGIGHSILDKAKCQADCDAAKCCNEKILECKVTNPEMCGVYYEHCGPLWGDNPLEILLPPANLQLICGPLSISTKAGRSSCEDACEAASCCSEPIEACTVTNPEVCGQYMPCAVLYQETTEEFDNSIMVPYPTDDLLERCSEEELTTTAGFNGCKEICDWSNCCNMPITECRVLNPEVCEQYTPCTSLYKKESLDTLAGTTVVIPPAPDDINTICHSLTSVANFIQCEDMCNAATCCEIVTQNECEASNPSECDDYYSCSNLIDLWEDPNATTLLTVAEEVEDACSPPKLATYQGQSHCQNLCKNRMCCFSHNIESPCVSGEECVAFAACNNLINYGYHPGSEDVGGLNGDPKSSAVLANTCTPDAMKTVAGINECHNMCVSSELEPYLHHSLL